MGRFRNRLYRFLATSRWNDSAIFFIRIFIGVMMIIHGLDKVQHYEMRASIFPDPIGWGSEASYILITAIELGCSALLIIGLLVRPAALVLAMSMFVATFIAIPSSNPFTAHELSFIYMCIYIALFISGGLKYSLDKLLFRKG